MGRLNLLSLIPPTLWFQTSGSFPGIVAPGLARFPSFAAMAISLTAVLISLMLLLASVSRPKKSTGRSTLID